MKNLLSKIVAIVLVLLVSTSLTGSVGAYWVDGYYRNDGTYVRGHYRSRANAFTYDNYSYTGPTRSNGYGYNNSYYSSRRSYSSSWYKPSYYDSGWGYEDSWSDYHSGRSSYFSW